MGRIGAELGRRVSLVYIDNKVHKKQGRFQRKRPFYVTIAMQNFLNNLLLRLFLKFAFL